MIQVLKNITKFFFYNVIPLFIGRSQEIKKKSIVIIKLDAIGDYVLFRNYIKILKRSERYRGHSLTIIGNSAWKSLAEEFDSEYVDSFIWVDIAAFTQKLSYRYKVLRLISQSGYEVALSPKYTRDYFLTDSIVKCVSAKWKIGFDGDNSVIGRLLKWFGDRYYDQLIQSDDPFLFEFYRNKDFFENVLDGELEIRSPQITLPQRELGFGLVAGQKYAVLFIGAGPKFRRWKTEGFVEVAEFLQGQGYDIVLCGAPGDKPEATIFAENIEDGYLDLVGKTSLIDLLYVLKGADVLISNETSVPHFAVALEIPNIFVVSNGNHYGRFTPYPIEICNGYHVIYHPAIDARLDDDQMLTREYGRGSTLDINEISAVSLKRKIEQVL